MKAQQQKGQKTENKEQQREASKNKRKIDVDLLQEEIGHNSDVQFRDFFLGCTNIKASLIYIIGLADKDLIDRHIMPSLMKRFFVLDEVEKVALPSFIKDNVLSISDVKEETSINEVVSKILSGSAVLLIHGLPSVLILGTEKLKTRTIEEPISEAVVRGPRIGFTESLDDNTSILRGYEHIEKLSFVPFQVGKRAKRNLVVAYVEEITNRELVEEVEKRIKKIDIDNVPESGYVEQLIEDNYLSPFPQLQSTERPDRVVAALMEGRVAILLEGTPFALIAPVTFSMMLQSPEDYYERWIAGTFIRLLRYCAVFLALFTPALYIAFISFHPGLIPTKLAVSIISTRSGVPFPSLIEALFLEIAIEILREAGLRLPKPIGPAMGIVGGLIIGEAAVQAGIVSPILVIVVALTAISSFTIPQYNAGIPVRILRFGAMLCAAILGLYGVILFFLFLISHVVKLKSFGVPYLSPAVPYRLSEWKDLMIRMPLMIMKKRPKMMNPKDSTREN